MSDAALRKLREEVARWRTNVHDSAARRALDAALYLAWANARGSHDLDERPPRSAGHIAATFARARERYGLEVFAAPAPDDLDAGLCSVIAAVWAPERTPAWASVPIESFGAWHEQHGAMNQRKAAGVYYTPTHVVRDMVERAFAVTAANRPPNELATLRILDPACGCGSFLLGAYRRLLAWHAADPQLGAAQLTTSTRLDLLARHIHGIDLDGDAIAVAELSLLFEALYGDGGAASASDPSNASPSGTTEASRLAIEALRAHLVCGNALVSSDFCAPGPELAHVRPLDVQAAFPQAFQHGGFDLVLGNPPYISYGGRQAVPLSPELRSYFAARYRAAGWSTAHSLFIERAISDLTRGTVSFIVPDQVAHLDGYASLRALVVERAHLHEVRYWGEDVFAGVATPSLSFVVHKHRAASQGTAVVDVDGCCQHREIAPGAPWTRARAAGLLEKLRARAVSVRAYLADCGVRTTNAKEQVVRLAEAGPSDLPVLEGKQIGRYRCDEPRVALRSEATEGVHIRPRAHYERAAFLIRQTAAYPVVGPRRHATYFRNSLHALHAPADGLDVHYLVAVLNSKLMRFAYVATVQEAEQRVFPQVKLGALGRLPIRRVDLSDAVERKEHDTLAEGVLTMLALQRTHAGERSAEVTRAIAALDARLDQLVYAAYRLDDADVDAVEQVVAGLRPPP